MKNIKWVAMSVLVMGLSVTAGEDVDGNPNRRRTSPCCNLGKFLKAAPVACLLTLAALTGQVQAQEAQVAVAQSVNVLPAGILIDSGVPCYQVVGKLDNGKAVCLKRFMCKNPEAQNPQAKQFEQGRLVGHIERLAIHAGAGYRHRLKELNVTEKRCVWSESGSHIQTIQCVRSPEALGHDDIAYRDDCGN